MPLDLNERAKLVEALLKCDCMKTPQSRSRIVRELPDDIQQRIGAGGTSKEDVDELVRVCDQFEDGIDALLQRVKFFEGASSYAWKQLEQLGYGMPTVTEPRASASIASPIAATGSQSGQPVDLFFSYAHKDEALRDELSKQLSLLKRNGVINEWHDRQIPPGKEWKEAIDERLDRARVILLLISPDFMASDYCHEIEMKRAMERHEKGEATVIPIILRPCLWEGALFGKLQALPKNARAVTLWPNPDEAFLNVAQGIRKVVDELRGAP